MNTNKKTTLLSIVAACLISSAAFSQAIRDRNVIPVAVNLNEVMRMTITNGGNIEFTFNTIDDYRLGLSSDQATVLNAQDLSSVGSANPVGSSGAGAASATNMYTTDFTISSSVAWKLTYGSEEATFMGTDDATRTMPLNNVGFFMNETGAHQFGLTSVILGASVLNEELHSPATDNARNVTALHAYPTVLIQDNDDATASNAGDLNDNAFQMMWRCGTTEGPAAAATIQLAAPMAALTLLNQGNIIPDRYIASVIFELSRDF